jgi:hypothetical protein
MTPNQGLPRTLPGAGILPATGHFHRPASHFNRPNTDPQCSFPRPIPIFPLLYLPVLSGFHRLSSRQRAGSVPSAPAEPQFPPARSRAIASSWQALLRMRFGYCDIKSRAHSAGYSSRINALLRKYRLLLDGERISKFRIDRERLFHEGRRAQVE